MWYTEKPLTKEEKKAKIAEYKAEKKAQVKKEEEEEEARAEALKKLSKAEREKLEADKKALASERKKAKEDEEKKKKAEKKALRLQEKEKISQMTPDEAKEYKEKKKAEKRAYVSSEFAKYKAEHDAKVRKEGEELSNRYDLGGRWKRFWFNVGQSKICQGYMDWWRKTAIEHPEGSKLIYQIFYFIVFSEGVTIWQWLVLTFLPYALGIGLAGTAFMWPQYLMGTYNGKQLLWNILGYEIQYDASHAVKIGGGLGYFIAFEIATFTAQCINFPLQRNITFKSHGNPWWQAMWYFIGWVVISFICNAFNGLWMPFGSMFMEPPVYNLLVMFSTGGISMVIFFFIFRIIFPAGEAPKEENASLKEDK
jgi:hypothetical protein